MHPGKASYIVSRNRLSGLTLYSSFEKQDDTTCLYIKMVCETSMN